MVFVRTRPCTPPGRQATSGHNQAHKTKKIQKESMRVCLQVEKGEEAGRVQDAWVRGGGRAWKKGQAVGRGTCPPFPLFRAPKMGGGRQVAHGTVGLPCVRQPSAHHHITKTLLELVVRCQQGPIRHHQHCQAPAKGGEGGGNPPYWRLNQQCRCDLEAL